MSADLALDVLDRIRDAGVRTICVCPGARNADWVRLLSQPDCGFEVVWFPEERSASFFALGRCREQGPTAVVTTSGTAVGELLPAVMEAYYSGFPLFLLTADRPRRFRGSGAPQAAEQAGIFGPYVAGSYDLEGGERLPCPFPPTRAPIHINACFEDPNSKAHPEKPRENEPELAPRSTPHAQIPEFERPLVIVGALEKGERPSVLAYLAKLQAPVYLESLSGLRGEPTLENLDIRVAEKLLARAAAAGYAPDGVIRVGGVPTHRFWRDLEDSSLPVLSISRTSFSGLGRPSVHVQASLDDLANDAKPIQGSEALVRQDRKLYACLRSALEQEPDSEPGLFRALSQAIPENATVFLGNSLPVREWDLAAVWRRQEVRASRGLNGIDGQISTFLGMCRPNTPNWAILGDLTTLYDLAAPWPLAQLPQGLDATLVIVNNGGGKIFDRMFPQTQFQNRHTLSFKHWAAMWNLEYRLIESAPDLPTGSKGGLRIIEVRPDAEATGRFWATYNEALQ